MTAPAHPNRDASSWSCPGRACHQNRAAAPGRRYLIDTGGKGPERDFWLQTEHFEPPAPAARASNCTFSCSFRGSSPGGRQSELLGDPGNHVPAQYRGNAKHATSAAEIIENRQAAFAILIISREGVQRVSPGTAGSA